MKFKLVHTYRTLKHFFELLTRKTTRPWINGKEIHGIKEYWENAWSWYGWHWSKAEARGAKAYYECLKDAGVFKNK